MLNIPHLKLASFKASLFEAVSLFHLYYEYGLSDLSLCCHLEVGILSLTGMAFLFSIFKKMLFSPPAAPNLSQTKNLNISTPSL